PGKAGDVTESGGLEQWLRKIPDSHLLSQDADKTSLLVSLLEREIRISGGQSFADNDHVRLIEHCRGLRHESARVSSQDRRANSDSRPRSNHLLPACRNDNSNPRLPDAQS